MSRHQVAYRASDKHVQVQYFGDATIAGHSNIGNFYHNGDGVDVVNTDSLSHVIYHDIQDILQRNGEQNMQAVKIDYDELLTMTAIPTTVTRAAAQTQQITHLFGPTTASNRKVIYTSSDVTKATVSASGLITAVATGTATITSRSDEGSILATTVVTIS